MQLHSNQSFVSLWNLELCNALEVLLDESFSTQKYIQNLPQVFKQGPSDHWVGLCVNGQLQAFCSIFPLSWLHQKHGLVRAACVGSVCAHPRARGLGLATLVLQEAFARASAAEYEFIFLFSDMQEFYGRVGYQPVGTEKFYLFEPSFGGRPGNKNEQALGAQAQRLANIGLAKQREFEIHTDVATWSLDKVSALWRHMCLHGAACESVLGYGEFQKIIRIPDMTLALSRNQGKISGSFWVGKGVDFQNIVHGAAVRDSAELFWLLSQWRAQHPGLLFTLSAGPWAKFFEKGFESSQTPSVLLQGLDDTRLSISEIKKMFHRNEIYVRSLHSS